MGAVELRNGASSQAASISIKSKQSCSAFLLALLIVKIRLVLVLTSSALHAHLLWRKGLLLYSEPPTAWKSVKFLLFYNKFWDFPSVLLLCSWSFSGRLRRRQCIWRPHRSCYQTKVFTAVETLWKCFIEKLIELESEPIVPIVPIVQCIWRTQVSLSN